MTRPRLTDRKGVSAAVAAPIVPVLGFAATAHGTRLLVEVIVAGVLLIVSVLLLFDWSSAPADQLTTERVDLTKGMGNRDRTQEQP